MTTAAIRTRLLLFGLVALAAGAFASPAFAACPPVAAPESAITPDGAGGWCATGTVLSGEDARLLLLLDATGLWTVAFDTLPGQGGLVVLTTADSRRVWEGQASAMTAAIASPPLLLAAAGYRLQLSTGQSATAYRIRVTPAGEMPPALGPSVVAAFAGSLVGTDSQIVVPWIVPESAAGDLWTLSAQMPHGLSGTLTLRDIARNTVLSTGSPDDAGVLRLPDLALPPGDYEIVIGGPPLGTPVILAAALDTRSVAFAAEPDDSPPLAHRLLPAAIATGRLATNGAYAEADWFVLDLPEADGVRLYDVTLTAPIDVDLTLTLADPDGRTLAERTAPFLVELPGLVLAGGRHLFKVAGTLPPNVAYTLLAEDVGMPAGGAEIEPNDLAEQATPLAADTLVAGRFDGDERDHIALGVATGLQLWDVEVTGEGVGRLAVLDGAGAVIATAVAQAGEPLLRISRLLLPPGSNVVRLDGNEGTWLLRARPLGAPVAGEEIEPNNDAERALDLPAGAPQTGWLDRADDRDFYAFQLVAPHRVTITLASPADVPVRMTLSWGEWSNRIAQASTDGPGGEPQSLIWEGLLQPGDYIVELGLDSGPSRLPYTIALDLPSFFDRPLDLEPNNEAWQAVAWHAGQPLAGVLTGNDTDWIALDPLGAGGPLAIRVDALGGSLQLRLAHGDPAALERIADAYVYAAGETATFDAPAGERLFLAISGGPGPYSLSIGKVQAPPPSAVTATLDLAATPVAAFEVAAQRLPGTLSVRNTGAATLMLPTRWWIGDERWRLEGLPPELAVPAGEAITVDVALAVPAGARDDLPIRVEVALGDGVAPAVAGARIDVATGAAPVEPRLDQPFPATMLGGLDVAWLALGATPANPAHAGLFDGVIDVYGAALQPGSPADIRLAMADVPVTGVILHPPAGGSPADRLADFAVEISRDGTNFIRVLEARLSPMARPQAFPFPGQLLATVVRLVPLSAQGGPAISQPRLAELQVIAAPDFVLDAAGFDIATPSLGGHVVRGAGFGEQEITGENAIWPGDYPLVIPAVRSAAPEWVMGFLDGRAARVQSLIWHERSDTAPEERIREVEILASSAGPLGPFVSLGRWRVDAAETPTLELAEPVWARAIAFRVAEPEAGRLALPERIEIREAPGPSILGAWGDLSPAGPFEAALPPIVAAPPPVAAVSHDAAAPTLLALGAEARGEVRRGVSEDWYAIDVPAGAASLHADFAGLSPDVALALVAADGREVPLDPLPGEPGTLVAAVTSGHWRLRVTQPLASVVVAWDTSGSVGALYPAVARMIRRLGQELEPGQAEVNLLPFRDTSGGFLMPDFSGDRADVYAALHAYPFRDSSSDAESALLFAAERLAGRVGSRAVVLLTDAAYSGAYKNEPLWQALAQGRTEVFALYLPADTDARRALAQQNLMADWAGAAGGHLSRFASQGDAEAELRRVAAWLDRPAGYAFVLAASPDPPPPGSLVVEAAPDAPAAATVGATAVAIILDASGSMLQRLGDRTRIDIARDALRELGRTVLPDGMPIALRVFGHDRPDSCENELFLPLAPLDRTAFAAAIDRVKSVNLARTSIAATIRAAAGDLAATGGSRLILLVTDGEETCGGDPMGEIAALRAAGFDIQLNIVGFAIEDTNTRRLLEAWATAGAGAYFNAADDAALGAAIGQAIALPYVVVDMAGNEVAGGVVGGPAIRLPPGTYRLRIGSQSVEREVTIRPGAEQRVTFGGA